MLVGICITSLIFNPYSSEWQTLKGFEAYEKDDLEQAKFHYRKALEIAPANVVAKQNLTKVKIAELENAAFEAHHNDNYLLAKKYYLQILLIDPNNSWAKENLKSLK